MKNLLKRVHRFWFFNTDPLSIGMFRIALGFILVVYYFMLGPNWINYYSPHGYFPTEVKSLFQVHHRSSFLNYISSDLLMWMIYGLSLIMAILLMLGVFSRLSVIWLWIMNFTIVGRVFFVSNGEEQVLAVVLMCAIFMPLDSSATIHHYLGKKKSPPSVESWSWRLLQVHVMLIYAVSLHTKYTVDAAWVEGLIVYYAIEAIQYSRWPGLEIFSAYDAILSKVLTYFTMIVETSFPVLCWIKKTAPYIACFSIFMHIGIGIFLEGVSMFNFVFTVAVMSFLPGEFYRKVSEFNQNDRFLKKKVLSHD